MKPNFFSKLIIKSSRKSNIPRNKILAHTSDTNMYDTYCTVFNECHQEFQYQVVLELKHIYIYAFQYFCWFCELWYYIFVSLVCANILFRGILLFIDDLIVSLEKKSGFKVHPLNKLGKMRYHTLWLDHWWKSYDFHLLIYSHPYSLVRFLPCGTKIKNEDRILPILRICSYCFLKHYNNCLYGINGNSSLIIYIKNV